MNIIAKSVAKITRLLRISSEKPSVPVVLESKLTQSERGKLGGLIKSEKKTLAARKNGKKGGRPRKHELTKRKTSSGPVATRIGHECEADRGSHWLHAGSSTAACDAGSTQSHSNWTTDYLRFKAGDGAIFPQSWKRNVAIKRVGEGGRATPMNSDFVVSAEVMLLAAEEEIDQQACRIKALKRIANELLTRLSGYEYSEYVRGIEKELNG
jgi:hypothetical protein